MNIYLEQVLIVFGIFCAVVAVVFTVYLFISRRRSSMYKKIIQEDTTEMLSLMQTTESFWNEGSKSIDLEKTEVMTVPLSYTDFVNTADNPTELMSDNIFDSRFKPIEEGVLEGKYVIEKEIGGGGMSRVYLARHKKLGNRWIIKYIESSTSFLAKEEDILKRLNHINLPKIADIFHDETGIYIVETYIEGISLDKALAAGQTISPALAQDFAEQLVMVLGYLHNLKPDPIIHCDLKPSNIIITPDNKLVLIDFGISKIRGQSESAPMAATYRYAAPEQLKRNTPYKYAGLVSLRFGDAGRVYFQGDTDERTDIFSMGAILFEIITGQIPTVNNKPLLKDYVSEDFANVIYKCICVNPDDRYDNIEQVRHDLQSVRVSKVSMLRSLFFRRAVFVGAVFAFVLSFTALAGGTYLIRLENGAVVTVFPEAVTVSMKQSTELVLDKIFEDGRVDELTARDFVWTVRDNGIAEVSGTSLIGLNPGSTEVIGYYKDKRVNIKVNVTENNENLAEVSLRYNKDSYIERWCGDPTVFESINGSLEQTAFATPESITMTENGDIYVSDSGYLRRYDGNKFSHVEVDQDFIYVDVVKAYGNDIYVLSDVYYNDSNEPVYGLYKLNGSSFEPIREFDGLNTNINDFAINDGCLYYAVSIPFASSSSITRYDPDTQSEEVIASYDGEIYGICVGNDKVYMSTYDDYYNNAFILQCDIRGGEVTELAGIKDMRGFIDSVAVQCYAPTTMQFYNDQLYFMDYNVLRKIIFEDGGIQSVTVAGMPSAQFDDTLIDVAQPCSDVTLSEFNKNFVVTSEKIYMTDTYNGYILSITE